MVPSPALAVFDIDGVLADVTHRLAFLHRTPADWDGFFAQAANDPPLGPGVLLARHYALDHDLVYLTGRPERLRAETHSWLQHHQLPAGALLMRGDRDRRPARVTKREALQRLQVDRRVAVVVDDDPDVVEVLRQAGLPVRLADWLPRSPVLHAAQERRGTT